MNEHQPQLAEPTCPDTGATLVVTGNSSLSREHALLFFASIAFAMLLICGGLALRGFWPVLPFAGLELFALGAALGLNMRRGAIREVISVTADDIVVETGRRRGLGSQRFARHWSSVELEPSAHRWYPSRLTIGSHGRRAEIGRALTESERRGLWQRLDQLIGPAGSSPALSPRAGADVGGPAQGQNRQ